MEQIVSSAIGALSVVVVAFVGLFAAKWAGIGTNQEKLVATLKELLEAQTQKIDQLEEEHKENQTRIQTLEAKVEELEALTITQALEIERLRKKGANGNV